MPFLPTDQSLGSAESPPPPNCGGNRRAATAAVEAAEAAARGALGADAAAVALRIAMEGERSFRRRLAAAEARERMAAERAEAGTTTGGRGYSHIRKVCW